MPVDRPTFSESWYRVAGIRPRLRSTVQIHRRHFRNRPWYVIQDPASNQFSRLSESGYHFIGLLDGDRTVADVWRICNEQLGDQSPTQGEAIQLLGQLYTSNLLMAELPPDAESLLSRYRKRKLREIQSYVSNILFLRIPLIDPDHFLDRWVGVFGRVFNVFGFLIWLILICTGLYFVAGRMEELAGGTSGIFDPDNLPWLYVSLALVKIIHEFGHGFACKRFGRMEHSGGEVHIMGIMLLVFTPLPYVDASSAWALRSKWHRVAVGAGGMFVELAIAAVAAVIWANTATGTTLHAICYNVMFVASVSTLLFNGNPLLRYDAYYILSDLLEIPNLAQRSKQYLHYLVKRYAWSVKRLQCPAHIAGERAWFVFYGIASTVYRVFIFAMILLFLTDRLPKPLAILAVVFGLVAAFMWLCVPFGKFVRYLATSPELVRSRARAVVSTIAVFALIFVTVGLVRFPNRYRVEGIVEPVEMVVVYADVDGFVKEFLPSCRHVTPEDDSLLVCDNQQLRTELKSLLAERDGLQIQRRIAQTQEPAAVQVITEQITALNEKIDRFEKQVSSLTLHPPRAGTWISPQIEKRRGGYVRRGDGIGIVANLDRVIIRATADQQKAALLIAEAELQVEIRIKGRPDAYLKGRIESIMPAGQKDLPSASLGYRAGGSIQTAMDDSRGTMATERFFEIRIVPEESLKVHLLTGQRVVVRFDMPPKPLIEQGWLSLLQLLQRRFQI